jgi:hypothetical protein
MAKKKLNIEGRFPKTDVEKAQKWGRSHKVKVTGIDYDPNDKNFVVLVAVEAPTDLLITQFKGQLG